MSLSVPVYMVHLYFVLPVFLGVCSWLVFVMDAKFAENIYFSLKSNIFLV